MVCEKELSHMDKNNGNPNLVCEKELSHMRKHNGNAGQHGWVSLFILNDGFTKTIANE